MPKTLIRLRDIPRRDIPSKDILLRRDIPSNILLPMLLNTLSLLLNNRAVVVESWKAVWLRCAVAVCWMPASDGIEGSLDRRIVV